jgi:hypothetical protein
MIITSVLGSEGWEQEKRESNRNVATPKTTVILSGVAGSRSEAATESKDPRTANITADVAGSSPGEAGCVGRIP